MKTVVGAIVFLALIFVKSEASPARNSRSEPLPRLKDTRIVGGKVTSITNFPHQISLRYKSLANPNGTRIHRCGGSIYWGNIVLTAAHCVIGTVPSQYIVVAGSSNRRGNDGYVALVKDIIMHEHYNPDNFYNDIALLELSTPLPINNFSVRAIELADQYYRDGVAATVSGWGTTSQDGYASDLLQEVQVPIVGNELCDQDYGGMIHESMLCAGVRGEGGKDACQGDSGGPLIVNDKLVGVVSWGYGCAQPNYPGVYANVTYLRPWVMEKVQLLNSRAAKLNN